MDRCNATVKWRCSAESSHEEVDVEGLPFVVQPFFLLDGETEAPHSSLIFLQSWSSCLRFAAISQVLFLLVRDKIVPAPLFLLFVDASFLLLSSIIVEHAMALVEFCTQTRVPRATYRRSGTKCYTVRHKVFACCETHEENGQRTKISGCWEVNVSTESMLQQFHPLSEEHTAQKSHGRCCQLDRT